MNSSFCDRNEFNVVVGKNGRKTMDDYQFGHASGVYDDIEWETMVQESSRSTPKGADGSSQFFLPDRIALKIPVNKTKVQDSSHDATAHAVVLETSTSTVMEPVASVEKQRILDSTVYGNSSGNCNEDGSDGPDMRKQKNRFSLFSRRHRMYWVPLYNRKQQQQHYEGTNYPVFEHSNSSSADWLDSMMPTPKTSESRDDDWLVEKPDSFALFDSSPLPGGAKNQDKSRGLHLSKRDPISLSPSSKSSLAMSSASLSNNVDGDTWAQETLNTKSRDPLDEAEEVEFATVGTGSWIVDESESSPKNSSNRPVAKQSVNDSTRSKEITSAEHKIVTMKTLKPELIQCRSYPKRPASRFSEACQSSQLHQSVGSPKSEEQGHVLFEMLPSTMRNSRFIEGSPETLDKLIQELSWSYSAETMAFMSANRSKCSIGSFNDKVNNDVATSPKPMVEFACNYFCNTNTDEASKAKSSKTQDDRPQPAATNLRIDVLSQKHHRVPSEIGNLEELLKHEMQDSGAPQEAPRNWNNYRSTDENGRRSFFALRAKKAKSPAHMTSNQVNMVNLPLPEIVVPHRRRVDTDDFSDVEDECSAITDPDFGAPDEYSFAGSDYSASSAGALFMDVE